MKLTTEQVRRIIIEELELQKYIEYFRKECRTEQVNCGDTDPCMDEFLECLDELNIIKKATQALEADKKIEDSPDEFIKKAKKKYQNKKRDIETANAKRRQIAYQKSKSKEKQYTGIIQIILALREKYSETLKMMDDDPYGDFSFSRVEDLAKMDNGDIERQLGFERATEIESSNLLNDLRDGAETGYWDQRDDRGYDFVYDPDHKKPLGYDEVVRFLDAARKEGYLNKESNRGGFEDKIPVGLYEEDESTGAMYFTTDGNNKVEIPLWFYSYLTVLEK